MVSSLANLRPGVAEQLLHNAGSADDLSWDHGETIMRQVSGVTRYIADVLRDNPLSDCRNRQRHIATLSTLLLDYYQWERNLKGGLITAIPSEVP